MLAIQVVSRDNEKESSVKELSYPPGWYNGFCNSKKEIELIDTILQTQTYFPKITNIFRCFDLCPLVMLKVVIIGQDPYHSVYNNEPQANGLAFSTNKGCPLQPSLKNIYKEIKNEYPEFNIPDHGDLTNWAEQGVLLLNQCLTVKPHEPNSHSNNNFWIGFITRMFEEISEYNPECIYLLWGRQANTISERLGERTIKLSSTHPSPFSANKGSKDSPAFLGCDHFKKANELLIKQGKTPINWTAL